MRFTLLSNAPWAPTGYGTQTALFGARIVKAGHAMAVISNYGHQGAPTDWNGTMKVYGNSFHPYCQDIMHTHSVNFKADFMMSLYDTQVMELEGLLGTKWVPWFPIDHNTIPPIIFEKIRQAFFRITMSKHASAEMDKTGIDYNYIPLGVDTKIYTPLDQAESRIKVQLPLDKFIVGMVAMNKGNPSRKAFHQNIAAFAALQKKYGDCVMYLHTGDGTRQVDGVNLPDFCRALGLKVGYAFNDSAEGADVIFADQYGMALGYDQGMLAQLYSSMDVHLLVTMGEGFGIPILEAQACGTPVVVGDWSSMPELCFSGWKVDKSEAEPIFTNLGAFQMLPRAAALAEKLEAAYQMRGNQDYRKRARDGALKYDVDKIFEKYFIPTLADIEARLHETKIPDRLAFNLDMLRVAA